MQLSHSEIQILQTFCSRNQVAMLGIFGSVARGEATEQSDLDILVRFSQKISLLEIVRLERQLSESLNRKVDLITEGSINPYLRDNIYQDLKVVYETR